MLRSSGQSDTKVDQRAGRMNVMYSSAAAGEKPSFDVGTALAVPAGALLR